MSAKRSVTGKHGHRQRGAVLMVMLVIMIVGIAAILVNSLTSSKVKSARQATTSSALAQAKDALIGFAITYGDTHSTSNQHGYLPCPDKAGGNPEGSAEPSCGAHDISAIGRLPWATLDLSAFRDGDGECLWYAVSGTYKDNSKTTGLWNWDTNGQFEVYSSSGTLLSDKVVAVIFAPGPPLSGQNQIRTADGTAPVCGGNYTASNYLDSDAAIGANNAALSTPPAANSVSQFFTAGATPGINDQMIFITRQDIWNAIQKRADFQNSLKLLTQRVAECLANYGKNNAGGWWPQNKSLPRPAPLLLSDYSDITKYDDTASLYAGRVPYDVPTSTLITHNAYTRLMTTATCPAGWATVDPWWNNWKDHLFYAIGDEFQPAWSTTQACGPCLKINGAGKYAAVVMFAGQRLSALNQTRADKSIVTHYLESNNASNFPGASGNENYQTAPASSTFDDVLYCIKEDLSVVPCP